MEKSEKNINSQETPQPKKEKAGNEKRKLLIAALVALFVIAGFGGAAYLGVTSKRVYIDKSEINAPEIALSPTKAGILEELFVKPGDWAEQDSVVARVGDDLVKTKDAGLIVATENNIGKTFNPGEAVVTMINPEDLRAVGHLEENKGLDAVKVGQPVLFTVDAFGSKQYTGTVDEISPTSRASGVVFNISDKRETRQFDVKVRYNIDDYPELKNGMSAKIWIYK